MVKVKIDISELKSEGDKMIKRLEDFLKEKTEAEFELSANEVIMDYGEKLSKQYLRVLLRKFLHKNELKEYFKVISGKEGSLKFKEKKIPEE